MHQSAGASETEQSDHLTAATNHFVDLWVQCAIVSISVKKSSAESSANCPLKSLDRRASFCLVIKHLPDKCIAACHLANSSLNQV